MREAYTAGVLDAFLEEVYNIGLEDAKLQMKELKAWIDHINS